MQRDIDHLVTVGLTNGYRAAGVIGQLLQGPFRQLGDAGSVPERLREGQNAGTKAILLGLGGIYEIAKFGQCEGNPADGGFRQPGAGSDLLVSKRFALRHKAAQHLKAPRHGSHELAGGFRILFRSVFGCRAGSGHAASRVKGVSLDIRTVRFSSCETIFCKAVVVYLL